jgi:hypothetical protein
MLVAFWACPLLALVCAAFGVAGGRRRLLVACAGFVALPFLAALVAAIVAPDRKAPGSDDLTWAGSLFLFGCFAIAAALIGLGLGGIGRAVISARRARSGLPL